MIRIDLDYRNIKEESKPISLCLGYFDGLHLGHKRIINEAKKHSEYPVGVLTFNQPISNFIDNHKSKEVLTSLRDKQILLNNLGIDYLFNLHINNDFVSLDKEEFIKILQKLNVKHIFVGNDYKFGKDASGDVDLLKKYFKVTSIDMVLHNGEKVSTQKIILDIKEGRISEANALLSRYYQVNGTVIEGHHVGQSIGFPTENIALSDNYVLPKFGVYKTIAFISGIPHLSITNVGVHPTVNKENKPIIEVHIPSYQSDDYGKSIDLQFVEFIRAETKFNSLDELKEQIRKDIDSIQK